MSQLLTSVSLNSFYWNLFACVLGQFCLPKNDIIMIYDDTQGPTYFLKIFNNLFFLLIIFQQCFLCGTDDIEGPIQTFIATCGCHSYTSTVLLHASMESFVNRLSRNRFMHIFHANSYLTNIFEKFLMLNRRPTTKR